MKYSTAFRAKMVKKMTGPRAMSGSALSRETGIPQTTLSRWLKAAAKVKGMGSNEIRKKGEDTKKRPQDWTAAEKLKVVLEAAALEEDALGGFLRSRGLHREQLDQWREQVEAGATEALDDKPRRRAGRSAEKKRIRQLERELARKEKALAETAALLVLKKKLDQYYAEDEDENMNPRSGE